MGRLLHAGQFSELVIDLGVVEDAAEVLCADALGINVDHGAGVGFVNDKALLAYSLILAINRPIEMLVTSLNVVGDAVASICVARSEGLLKEEVYNK